MTACDSRKESTTEKSEQHGRECRDCLPERRQVVHVPLLESNFESCHSGLWPGGPKIKHELLGSPIPEEREKLRAFERG